MDGRKFRDHVNRHGVSRTLVHYGFSWIRRFTPCEVVCVFTATGTPVGDGEVDGYVTREVTAGEFEAGTVFLPGDHTHAPAFRGGDRCFANCLGKEIVGYTLYTSRSTRLRDDLELHFPDGLEYGYASYTAPAHRGMRLALARSDKRKRADRERGLARSILWYVAIDNYASLASLDLVTSQSIGYIAYIRVQRRYLISVSRGCRRFGVCLTASGSGAP